MTRAKAYFYETKRVGGSMGYLVPTDSVDAVIDFLSNRQGRRNWFTEITVKDYNGKKYSDCKWVFEG